MELQNYQKKDKRIIERFKDLKLNNPDKLKEPLELSFSSWLFGIEDLDKSVARLKKSGLKYIELPGNHHSPDLGLKTADVKKILRKYEMKVSGVCGIFYPENDLASNCPYHRQAAIDYLKREIEFVKEVEGQYVIMVPSAVGRPEAIDENELQRSVEAARVVAEYFEKANIKAAVEPIRSAEVSLINTIKDAKQYIDMIGHNGIRDINGDIYHMLNEEKHIGEAILEAGDQLVNIHLADSNRSALGDGIIDIDIVIMSLYLINYNVKGKFVTGEPLGLGGDPYQLMNGKTDSEILDRLVKQTIDCFKEREQIVVGK